MAKKQIVFMGARPVHAILKIARALKLTNKYEIILVNFSKIEEKVVKESFDKILTLELDLSISFKALFHFFKKLTQKETHDFFKKVKGLNPYIIQIHNANHISFLLFLLVKKRPKIFFLHDIWHYYQRKFSFKKNSGRMQYVSVLIEKFCFKRCEGIVNKSGERSLDYLKSKIKAPILDFLPYCSDEWIIPPKKKIFRKNKEIHIVYAGMSWEKWDGHVSFQDMVEKIINQGLHLHFYPSVLNEKTKIMLENLVKKNRFLHLYQRQDADKINKEISKYDYAIHLDFCDDSINPLWTETGMSAKIFGYIEAGLPVIINKQLKNMCNILEKNKIGKGITYKDLGRLKEILFSEKYPSTKDIKKAQDKFRISRNINRLENFYDKIHKRR